MGRPRTSPLFRARRYMRAARSVTTSGRFSLPASPLNWFMARERFRAMEVPAAARSCVRLSLQSWRRSSALRLLLEACARDMIVDRFLSNAENLPGGPVWLSSNPSSVLRGMGAAYCSVGSDSTKPQFVQMTSPVSASRTRLELPHCGHR